MQRIVQQAAADVKRARQCYTFVLKGENRGDISRPAEPVAHRAQVSRSERPAGPLVPGTLEDASVVESERLAYGVYLLDDGQRVHVTTPMTDSEIDEYRRDPDHFFGVFDPVPKQISNQQEFYEFILSSYQETSRESLLEFLAAAPDIEELKKLSQPDLAKTYAERLAAAKFPQGHP